MNFVCRTISSIESVLERDTSSVEIDPAATETETEAIKFFQGQKRVLQYI
jgi:hypothetical protein